MQQWIWDCSYLLDSSLSPLDINSKEWFLVFMIVLFTIFWGTSLIPTNRHKSSISLLCYQYLLFSFYGTHPERWYFLLMWLPFHWYLMMLSTIPIYIDHVSVFYEEMSIEVFYTYFKVIYSCVVLSELSCSNCLYILNIGPLFRWKVCRYFSFFRLPFYYVDWRGDHPLITW